MSARDYTPRQRKRLRLGFGIAFVLLILQFLIIQFGREFYPSFVMPMFKGVNGQQGEYQTLDRQITVAGDGQTRVISMEDLLFDMSESYRFFVLYQRMGPVPAQQIQGDAAYTTWLRDRLQTITGWETIESFRVDWMQVKINTRVDPVAKTRVPFGSYIRTFAEEEGGQ